MVGNGIGAKSGILYKTAAVQELAGRTQIVALDKTGTITSGNMSVTDVFPLEGTGEEELISIAFSLENKSEHPIAKAIVAYAEEKGNTLRETTDFAAVSGNGLKAKISGISYFGGSSFRTEEYGHTCGDADRRQCDHGAGHCQAGRCG